MSTSGKVLRHILEDSEKSQSLQRIWLGYSFVTLFTLGGTLIMADMYREYKKGWIILAALTFFASTVIVINRWITITQKIIAKRAKASGKSSAIVFKETLVRNLKK